MTQTYKAITHGLGPKNGTTRDIILRGDGFEVSPDPDLPGPILLPYGGMQVGFGGVDDRYIVIEGEKDARPYKILIGDKSIVSALQAIGAPGRLVEALQQTEKRRSSRAMGRLAVFAGLGLTATALIAFVWVGFGAAVDKGAEKVPLEWEAAMGRAAAISILESKKLCSDPELVAAVNALGARLIGALEQIPFDFRIRVVDDDTVNAFALPGGYLFINRGLIQQADSSHEVAGVIAHEIQHAMQRHGMRNLLREAGVMLLLQAVVGDVGAVEQFLLYNAASLTTMSFSREQEAEADIKGLDLVYGARLDPEGLPQFLEKLAAKEGRAGEALEFLSTHPASAERADTLRRLIAARGPADISPPAADITQLSDRCDPVALTDPDAPL